MDELIAEAVESDEETFRFDALELVRAFDIQAAVPSLRRLAARLVNDPSPGAPFELEKVNGILVFVTSR